MLLLLTTALFALLLYRTGWFSSLDDHRDALMFETHVLQIAEDVEWDAQMREASARHQAKHPQPIIRLR